MKKKISSKLRILLCFGVIIFTALGFTPLNVSAHHANMGNHVAFQVYDGDTPWDDTYVGWFEHDKKVSSSTKWYTQAYHVTTYSVPGCYVPADAYLVGTYNDYPSLDCTESGFVDTGVLFDKWKITKWAMQSGATPDNDGTLTVWLQPTIGIKTQNSSGGWDDAGVSLKNLYDWTKARNWANTSTFAGHYNKPLHLKYQVPGGVTVKYQTLNAGDGYNGRQDILPNASYSYNLGSVHSYSETGIKSHIDWNVNNSSRRMALVGVEVTKDASSVTGTSGLIRSNVEENNRVYPESRYSLAIDNLSDVGQHSNNGYQFTKTSSSMYNLMVGQSFRSTFGTTITYLYAEVYDKSTVYPAMLFSGYETMQLTGAEYIQSAGTDFNYSGSQLVDQKRSYKNAIFELVRTAFYKADKNNLLVRPSTGVANRSWNNDSAHNYDLSTQEKWNNDYNNNNKLLYTAPQNPTTYEYLGTYQVRAPQIELCYYKDDLGRYHLFSVTSGGNKLTGTSYIDQYKRNTWKNNNDTTSCTVKSILRNQEVTIDNETTKKNMVLTEAYAYSANANDSVKEYNGDRNCWTDSSLPINGTVDAKSHYKQPNSQDAYKDAIDANGKVTKRTTTTVYGTTPTIFVSVYEGGPILTVKSYYTTDPNKDPNNNPIKHRIYYYEAPQSGTFTYGAETLKRGMSVQYPIGTEQVSIAVACDQDGLGNGDGSLIKQRGNGVTVECRKSRFSTTNEDAVIRAIKKLTITSKVNEDTLDATCKLWGQNWNGVINFKAGQAAMVKLYEANPIIGYWKVSYADLEDGEDKGGSYSLFKNTYYRVGRPRLVELDNAVNGEVVKCGFTDHVLIQDADDMTNGDYTLVNVGTSKKTDGTSVHTVFTEDGQNVDMSRDYSYGYVSDIVNNKKTGYSNYAEQHYALTKMNNLEKPGNSLGIVWMLDPYAATSRSQLDFTADQIEQWESKASHLDFSKVWMWAIYKPDKAINRAYVLENTEDNSLEVISGYQKENLDVYTTKYNVSYEPYITYNGKLLRLERIMSDNYATTPDLEADTSIVNSMADNYPVTYNDKLEVNAESNGVLQNTRRVRIQKKMRHVVGVYREYTAGEGGQSNPDNKEEIIAYRDTEDMTQGNNSWSSAALELTRRARFQGMITNDKEWSSDPDYVAETAIPSSEYLRTDAKVPKYLVDIDFSKITTHVRYTIHCFQAVNAVRTYTDKYNNTVKEYTGKAMIEDVPIDRVLEQNRVKTKKWFGFRLHLIADATYEIPVVFAVTKASNSIKKNPNNLRESLPIFRGNVLPVETVHAEGSL